MAEHEAENARLPTGTRVQVTERSVSGDRDIDKQAAIRGEYDVEVFCPGAQGDDPEGRDYYLLDRPGNTYGGAFWAYPEHVEVVMTVRQKSRRKPPSLTDVRADVAGSLHDMWRSLDVDETHHEGDNAVRAYGQTDEGLPVSFRIRIDQIEVTDRE